MSSQYPKSEGVMFTNAEKKAENHPDMRGHVDVTKEQITKLIEMGKAGIQPRLSIAGWNRQAKSTGQPYMHISAEAYMKEQQPDQQGWGEPAAQEAQPAVDDFDDVPY